MGLRAWLRRKGEFPPGLGVGVQKTVLSGELPAQVVAHDEGGFWLIGDGVNEPDPDTNMVLAHIGPVLEANPRLAELSDLPRGTEASWCEEGQHWHREPMRYLGDDEQYQPLGG